jgi:hypothetical protein
VPAAGSARAAALVRLERGCPRCAARRAARQRYCLECGLPLPPARGALARLRRGWIARLGWYPGDFVWLALLAALLAAGAGFGAVDLDGRGSADAATTITAASAPLVGGAAQAARSGWTVVLDSLPVNAGTLAAETLATRARAAGLPDVAVIHSSLYASLPPGYEAIVSGLYASLGEAQTGLRSIQARGYAAAYVSQVVPGGT